MKNSRKSDNQIKNVISEKVRYYRQLNNYTYESLSNELMLLGIDIHWHSLYNIEKGKRTVVDYEICRFSKMFSYNSKRLIITLHGSIIG